MTDRPVIILAMPKIAASDRDAYYEQRRADLSEVALQLWAKQGVDQTSVAQIAREAGIAKGTFYLYFESKEALLVEVFRRNSLFPNVMRLIEDLRTESLEVAVRDFVRSSWGFLKEHRELLLVALRELPGHLDEAEHVVERLLVPGNKALAGFLESHMPAGRTEQMSSILSVRALIGMVVVVFISQELLGARRLLPFDDEQVTNTVAELFLRGVTFDPGALPRSTSSAARPTEEPPA